MKLFFQIFLLLFSKKLCFHIIKLPFKKCSKYIEGNNYINYLEKNDVAVIVEIGNLIQSIPIFLNFDIYPFYISIESNKIRSQFDLNIIREGYESMEKINIYNIKDEK